MKEKIKKLISERKKALNEINETDSDAQATKVWINDNFVKQLQELLDGAE